MAPELITDLQNKKYEMPSDMWSMGVILYALITCTLPFMADTVKETNNLVVNSEERYD